MEDIAGAVKSFVLARFLEGEDPSLLTDTTPLISGGIMDSLARIELVAFLEDRFGVLLEPHELDRERLDTIVAIVQLVRGKLSTA